MERLYLSLLCTLRTCMRARANIRVQHRRAHPTHLVVASPSAYLFIEYGRSHYRTVTAARRWVTSRITLTAGLEISTTERVSGYSNTNNKRTSVYILATCNGNTLNVYLSLPLISSNWQNLLSRIVSHQPREELTLLEDVSVTTRHKVSVLL